MYVYLLDICIIHSYEMHTESNLFRFPFTMLLICQLESEIFIIDGTHLYVSVTSVFLL